jgi:D-aminopeptidase
VQTLADPLIDSLFYAAIEATEEAIVNSLVAAETMIGGDDVIAYGLPHDELVALMQT